MIDFSAGQTATRIPYVRTDLDEHRAEIVVRGDPIEIPMSGFDPQITTEVDGRRTIQPAVLYVNPMLVVHELDEWEIDGYRYEVVGVPTRIANDFTGDAFDTEIELKRVAG